MFKVITAKGNEKDIKLLKYNHINTENLNDCIEEGHIHKFDQISLDIIIKSLEKQPVTDNENDYIALADRIKEIKSNDYTELGYARREAFKGNVYAMEEHLTSARENACKDNRAIPDYIIQTIKFNGYIREVMNERNIATNNAINRILENKRISAEQAGNLIDIMIDYRKNEVNNYFSNDKIREGNKERLNIVKYLSLGRRLQQLNKDVTLKGIKSTLSNVYHLG